MPKAWQRDPREPVQWEAYLAAVEHLDREGLTISKVANDRGAIMVKITSEGIAAVTRGAF
jgi:hypothetical protein